MMWKSMIASVAVTSACVGLAPCVPAIGAPAPAQPKMPAAFTTCAASHNSAHGAAAGVGPNLFGVVGAKAGSRPGFVYSAALKKSCVTWTSAYLARYIASPNAVAPGTTMPNPSNTSAKDRAAIVAYIAAFK